MKGKSGVEKIKGKMEPDPAPSKVYAGAGSNVIEEAKERKRGGRVMKHEGKMSKMRLDRPGRKRGGRVGADKSPLSSAAKGTNAMGHSADGG